MSYAISTNRLFGETITCAFVRHFIYVVPERYWFVSGGLQMPWLNFIREMIPNSSLLNKCILTEAYEMHHWFKHHDIILNMCQKKTLDCAREKEVNMPLFMSLRKSLFIWGGRLKEKENFRGRICF